MKIVVTQVFVDDQERALTFYTEILGFRKKAEVPLGKYRWLTVVSPEQPDGVELLLEPSDHPAVKPFKETIFKDGIPYASFEVADVDSEYRRLIGRGVEFTQPPTNMGTVKTVILNDTCGNLIQIAQRVTR